MKKAVLYARVSSKGQEQEGFSIPSQVKLLKEYAQKNDLQIVEEFIDVQTAGKKGRVGFGKMLKFLGKNKSVTTVLFEKTDRMTRNYFDLAIMDELIEENDVELHLVKENLIINKRSNSSDKFMVGIYATVAKKFINNLSEETFKGMLEKAEQGIYPHRAPIGYTNIKAPNGKNIIGVDFKKAPFIKKMFKLYATGAYSLNTLRQKMFEEGFTYTNNKPLPKSQVEFILKNEFYTGVFNWKGKRYENAQHDAIISKELFYKVRDKLIDPRKSLNNYRDFAYTNMIKCDVCGCYLTADIKKGKYIYYFCTQNKGKHAKKYIRQEHLEEHFANVFRSISLTQEDIDKIQAGLKILHKQKIQYENLSTDEIQVRIKKLQGLINKCYEDKLEGVISNDFWQEKTKEWQEEKDLLVIKLDALNKANKDYLINSSSILELCKDAHSMFLSKLPEERRKLLNLVCSNFSFDNEKLNVELISPFNDIFKANQQKLADVIDITRVSDSKIVELDKKILPRLDSNQQPTG